MPYVVWHGRKPGVYETWEEAQEQVRGYSGAKFRKFKTVEDALAAFNGVEVADVYCDASYRGNALHIRVVNSDGYTMHMDMWGVDRNAVNVGEFIAAIRGLQLSKGTVATDSQVAYDWIMTGTVNTTLTLPDQLQKALDDAVNWLKANPEVKFRLKKIDRAFNKAD